MSQVIKPGENALVTRSMKLADGTTPLLFASLTGAIVELRQNGLPVVTKTLGVDPELRQGPGTATIRLEITAAMRAQLADALPLEIHWWTTVGDADFSVDSATHKDWAHDPTIDVFSLV